MKKLALALTLLAVCSLASAPAAAQNDADAIRAVIQSAYIDGIHMNGSREAIRAGFHPAFVMTMLRADGQVAKVDIEQWIGGLPDPAERPDNEITGEVTQVDTVGDTATARVEVYRDGEHIYTDFMGLYRFAEGWRIVNKIFQGHE